jgi:four helix bundle protein
MNAFSYKKLIVWQKSVLLMKEAYLLTDNLPKSEEYNLKSQLRRASVSVLSNIAEGSTRSSALERKRFLEIARGSVVEVDAQLEACLILNYLGEPQCSVANGFILEIFKMLSKMIDNLGNK